MVYILQISFLIFDLRLLSKLILKNKYKEEYVNNLGKKISTEETPEMILSKELQPIYSKKQYESQSREIMPKENYGIGN